MKHRHYLDHASTTPLRREAAAAIRAWLDMCPAGDPGRLSWEAHAVRAAIEEAREKVSALVGGVSPRQVVFTSGGTEAVALAVWAATRRMPGGAVICPAVEHSAVLKASALFAPRVEVVPVDREGRVDCEAFCRVLDAAGTMSGSGSPAPAPAGPVALAHCQVANHEVGTLQPVSDVAGLCRARGVLLHVDACAAAPTVALDMGSLGADLLSLSAHKIGGPPGVGALVVRTGLTVAGLLAGGAQERGRRAGMENVPGIVGFGAAAEALASRLGDEARRARQLTGRIVEAATSVPGVSLAGPADPERRVPHIACCCIEGVLGEPVLLGLESAGVAVHSGSACASEAFEPSAVLAAMGLDGERSVRISVGWSSTADDVEAFCSSFPDVLGRLQALAVPQVT